MTTNKAGANENGGTPWHEQRQRDSYGKPTRSTRHDEDDEQTQTQTQSKSTSDK